MAHTVSVAYTPLIAYTFLMYIASFLHSLNRQGPPHLLLICIGSTKLLDQ